MLSRLRSRINPIRQGLAKPFLALGMGPNTVGILGMILAALAAFLLRFNYIGLAFALATLAFATDLIDGEVARSTQKSSPWGNYLDAVGDRLTECLLLLGLLPAAPNLVGLALAGSCLTSYAKARCALVLKMTNDDWPGLGGYPDRATLILIAYALAFNPNLPLIVLVAVSWVGAWQRTKYAEHLIKTASPRELQPYLRPKP